MTNQKTLVIKLVKPKYSKRFGVFRDVKKTRKTPRKTNLKNAESLYFQASQAKKNKKTTHSHIKTNYIG